MCNSNCVFFLRISGEVNKLIIWNCVLDVLTCMDGINWLIRIFIMKNIVFYLTEILVDCNILRNVGNTDLWSLINCHFEISFLISSQSILLLTVWLSDSSNLCMEECAGHHVVTSQMEEACLFAMCLKSS